MTASSKHPALDFFRLASAFLVVAIHISPLQNIDATADFIWTRVIARVAVPFFFMATGYFLASHTANGEKADRPYFNAFQKKTAILYAAAIALYLPLNFYTGYFGSPWRQLLKDILFNGTFYHLWYLPAVLLGAPITILLWRRYGLRFTFVAAIILYVIGLGGDSYYGLVSRIPALKAFYDVVFSITDYTRNGLFLAPVFLATGAGLFVRNSTRVCLGNAPHSLSTLSHPEDAPRPLDMPRRLWRGLCRRPLIGLIASGGLLTAEALWLRNLDVQRHDSMYITLIPCMYFLFGLLLQLDVNRQEDHMPSKPIRQEQFQYDIQGSLGGKMLRAVAMVIYIIHPWCIVLIRGFSKLTHLSGLLVDNQPVLYILVCAVSAAAAFGFIYIRDKAANLPVAIASMRDSAYRLSDSLKNLYNIFMRPRPSYNGRAWIEIDRQALRHNAEELRKLLPASCRLMAVVKADGYGHGAVKVAGELQKLGVEAFAVATLGEGIALRRGGIQGEVLILGYTRPDEAKMLRRFRLSQTIVDGAYAKALDKTGVKIDVHIEVDTGMHRLGVDSGAPEEIEHIFGAENLTIKGMFTHLSEADNLSGDAIDFTLSQISLFIDTVNTLKLKGYDVGKLHIQESYGILNYPGLPCDYARAGIALYGVLCKNDKTRIPAELKPVLALKARIAEVRWIREGEPVSYNRSYMAASPMKIATVTIGYADGIPRNSVGRDAYVLLNGRKAPIVGRICMDLLVIDVTAIENAGPGDVVTVIGQDGGEALRCEDVAESCGTITNELLSRLGTRLPRVYV